MNQKDAERLVTANVNRLAMARLLGTKNSPTLEEYDNAISEVVRIIEQIRNDETLKAAYEKLGLDYTGA